MIAGRLYDQHVLDMVELGVEEYIGIADFAAKENVSVGTKPAFLFNGTLFETNEDYKIFANIIVGVKERWDFLFLFAFFLIFFLQISFEEQWLIR